MAALDCPFHVECQFHNSAIRTPSDELLLQLFCHMHYEDCEIAHRILSGRPVPAGACPDGNVRV
jgi:hypothetical protein